MISKISHIFIALAVLCFLVNTQTNQNQQTINNIVNAITQSGINSGIDGQHLQRVLGSDSLNTSKATINVINIVPKKSTSSSANAKTGVVGGFGNTGVNPYDNGGAGFTYARSP